MKTRKFLFGFLTIAYGLIVTVNLTSCEDDEFVESTSLYYIDGQKIENNSTITMQQSEEKEITVSDKYPDNGKHGKSKWSSSDENVVNVEPTKGNKVKITALKPGKATISVKDEAKKHKLSFYVDVVEADVAEVFGEDDVIFASINDMPIDSELILNIENSVEVYIGNSKTRKETEYQKCNWSCSDENVVSMSKSKGNRIELTARSLGEADIQVTDESGKNSLTLKVSVREKPSPYSAKIDFFLNAYSDLLDFVTPEVLFTEDGEEKEKYLLAKDDFKTHDSIDEYEYPMSWEKTVSYQRWGLTTDMIVKWIPKDNPPMNKDSYNFWAAINWNSAQSIGPNSILYFKDSSVIIIINIGKTDDDSRIKKDDDGNILKESVNDYIQQLAAHPDTLTTRITEDGVLVKVRKDK